MKALFIGLGSIGQRHLRNLREVLGDSVDIIAYRAKRQVPVLNDKFQVDENANLAEKYNLREFDDLDEALNEKPDIAFITNPTSHHVDVALKAAQAGCHLFIEKPIDSCIDKVDELAQLVTEKGLITTVAYQLRFHPGLNQVFRWLQEKRIGNLLSGSIRQGEYLPGFHPYEDYRISYASRKELGGGVILTQIHEFDYALWFFGLPQRIVAVGGKYSYLEVDVEDTATILMECKCDGRTLPVTLTLDYLQKPPDRNCIIIGDHGKIVWDFHGGHATLTPMGDEKKEVLDFSQFYRPSMFIDELKQFLNAVAGKGSPSVDLQCGIDSLRMALAARESLETGKIVSL
jgi:predicted dehydrogenase